MKQKFIIITSILSLALIVFISCQKKDSGAISPGYKENVGTGGNPTTGPTVTGVSTASNPATDNSTINNIGGSGWTNPTCLSTGGKVLIGISGSTKVTLTFYTAPASGTFAIAPSAGPNACSLMVENAPNQPAGVVWYGRSGTVVVSSSTAAVNASFNSIQCVQANFGYPSVTVSGAVGCSK